MKRLALPLMFVLFCSTLEASELPLLNLEIGKTYHIETTTHIDTSVQWQRRFWDYKKWEFTPTKYNQSSKTYTIKAVLAYHQHVIQQKFDYRGWMENYVYETGYLGSYRSPIVYMNHYKIPFWFNLSEEGTVNNIDFSAFKEYKTPEGHSLELYESNQTVIEEDLNMIFLPITKYIDINQCEYDKEGYYKIAIENNKTLPLNRIHPQTFGLFSNLENCKILIDKKTGLILRNHLNYTVPQMNFSNALVKNGVCNQAVYYQKYIPEHTTNFKALQYNPYTVSLDTVITSSNFKLVGKLKNRIKGFDSIVVSLIEQNINLKLPLNDEDHFQVEFKLKHNEVLQLFYPPVEFQNGIITNEYFDKFKRSVCHVTIEPGDELNLLLSYNDTLQIKNISGIGSENQLNLMKGHSELKYSTIYTGQRFSKEFYSEIEKTLARKRTSISPQVYINNLTNLTYTRSNIPQKTDDSYVDKLLVNNTLAKESRIYLNFLENYIDHTLDAKISLSTGVDNYNLTAEMENNYYLGQLALSEPVRSYFLANYLGNIISKRHWDLSERLYQSFKMNYSDKPVFTDVEHIYNDYRKIAPGQPAPGFEITGLNGEKLTNHSLNNQVAILFFYSSIAYNLFPNRESDMKAITDIYKQTESKYPNQLRYILIFGGSTNDASELKKQLPNEIEIFTDSPYPKAGIFREYKINSSAQTYFILDRNGKIVYNNPMWYSHQLPVPEVEKALAIPYESGNDLPIWLRIALIALIGALISIVLTFIFYRGITKRRLQKSELNKKMRELELTAIRAQMNPHFMYNCLNSIQNLVQKQQNDEAHLYLSKFASLIRRTLNNSKKEEITLAEELETIQEYVDLEKLRFEFDYELEVGKGINLHSVFFPPMLLQPFVENALLHGLLPKSPPRKLTTKIFQKEKQVCIEIEDNGIGRSTAQQNGPPGSGKGLLLSRERLKLLEEKYKTGYHFEIVDLTDENGLPLGTRVSLCFMDE